MRTGLTTLNQVLSPVALLTALPVARGRHSLSSVGIGLFPAVGLLIGAGLVAIDLVARAVLPLPAASAVVVVALVVLTGALHLDGLADTADGLFGGRDREHRLAIMSDPRTGAFGFVAIAAVLLLKWAALIEVEGWLRMGALLLVPMLARWALLPALLLWPNAKPDGMAARLSSKNRLAHAVAATALALAVSLAVFWPVGAGLLAVALVTPLLVGAYVTARLGGTTGDVLGAIVEVGEAMLLLVVATSVSHAWLT